MIVEVHDRLRKTTSITASRVIVYDIYDNPIAAVIEVEPGQYVAVTASNKRFNEILEAMGITKTLVVTHLDASKLPILE